MAEPRIVVAGAGAVGCFVGGLLADAGRDVTLLGRARVMAEAEAGLRCTALDGSELRARPETAVSPDALASSDIVLVCVKSGASGEMGAEIAAHAPEGAVVISLQNGVGNAAILREALPGRDVRAGVVGFNVVRKAPGHFHRSTSGEIFIEGGRVLLAPRLAVPGLALSEVSDIEARQWGKLVLNLNNAVNALSRLPLREMMLTRGWRRVMAAQMREALDVLQRAGVQARVPAPVPAGLIPHILQLPTPLFRRVAAAMLSVDGEARASMVSDLEAGRRTEIGQLQGEILALAEAQGRAVPVTRRVFEAIRAAEAGDEPALEPRDLL